MGPSARRVLHRGLEAGVQSVRGEPRALLPLQDTRWQDMDVPDAFALPCSLNGVAIQTTDGKPLFIVGFNVLGGRAVIG